MYDGVLHLIEYYETEDDHNKHIDFIKSIIDFTTFCNLYEIDETEYDESDNKDFLSDYIEELSFLSEMELEEFVDYFETNIDEDKYNEINEMLSTLDVMNFESFNVNYNLKANIKYLIYNPDNKTVENDNEIKEMSNSKKRKLIETIKTTINKKITQLP